MEVWKNIQGYENLYQISNMGNVKSFHKGQERILKPIKNNHGYEQVNLCKEGKVKKFSIHRLVAIAFIPNPNNYEEVNHIDEDASNNNVTNLEWCDRKYNVNYGTRTQRQSEKIKGENHPKAKTVICITTNVVFNSIKEASEYYNIKQSSHICDCCQGKRKSTGKYQGQKLVWKYLEIQEL